MNALKHRTRLALEPLEDRRTPSAFGSSLAAAPFTDRLAAPPAVYTPGVHVNQARALTVLLAFRCNADVSDSTASATGYASYFGRWTGQGGLDYARVDPANDRAEIRGTLTVQFGNGDKMFVAFTSAWRLSTGRGTDHVSVTGGTGRFAGASGSATLSCVIRADPTSPTRFQCLCIGYGSVILAGR